MLTPTETSSTTPAPLANSATNAEISARRASEAPPTRAVDWLIVGGGIHGVHVAARLIGEAGLDPARLRILDPGADLLERWRQCTETIGMSHLRSPGVHHLDLEPFSLIHFAGPRRNRPRGLLRAPYDRPSLDLFNAHCEGVIERYELRDLHLRGHARACDAKDDGVAVTSCDGRRIEAERVILAIGAGERPYWPAWAPRHEAMIQHVFAGHFQWPEADDGPILVVGGGISAAQVALRAADDGRPVHLVIRHPLRVHAFDSDPGWLGPKRLPEFQRLRRPDERRRLIQQVRNRGSVTPEIYRDLKHAVSLGRIQLHEGQVDHVEPADDQTKLVLSDGRAFTGAHLLLATGFDSRRPGGPLLDRLIDDAELPCASCGYPVVDPLLRWHPRIHVTGPLAELELGPVSRNIAGARRAGDRLVQALSRLH